MFRLVFVVVTCFACLGACAGEPPAMLIAVSNYSTASSLPPLPRGASVAVLIHAAEDDYATINARALVMRHAKYFVFDRDDHSPISQMFRERLIGVGAIPVELPKPRVQVLGLADSSHESPSNHPPLHNLFVDQ